MRNLAAALLLAVGSGMAVAQPVYQFEMRLIADGGAGAPNGPWPMYSSATLFTEHEPTRIGFWLQARVAVTGGENWGIMRAGASDGEPASIAATNTIGWPSTIQPGAINAGQTLLGSANGYRHGDGDGQLSADHRLISGFDAYVGSTRNAVDPDDPQNPWGVNGSNFSTPPVPGDGTFAPWANLYRFYVDLDVSGPGFPFSVEGFSIHAVAMLTVGTGVADEGNGVFTMLPGGSRFIETDFSIYYIPAPAATGILALGGLWASRRRR